MSIAGRSPFMRDTAGPMPVRRFSWWAGLLATAALWAAPAVASPSRPARHPAATTVKLQLAFHRLGSGAYVLTTGRFVFVASLYPSTQTLGMLIDEQTSTNTPVSPPPGCAGSTGPLPTGPAILGGPWLLVNCTTAQSSWVELYRLASGTWTTVAPDPGIEQFCRGAGMTTCAPVAVGANWIEFDETCYHCAVTTVFQDLHTGVLRGDPRDTTTIVDLNSAALAKPVCRPLRVPAPAPGRSLFFDGPFAIAEDAVHAVLERCGTHLHQRIGVVGAQPGNLRAIAWLSGNSHLTGTHDLSGRFLPTLRPFVISLPALIGYPNEVVLSTRRVYVVNNNNHVWVAASPKSPRGG